MAHSMEFLTLGERVEHAIAALPTLSKEEIPLDDACPICLQGFGAIYEGKAQEEVAADNGLPNGTDPEEHRGVTKLSGCGHVFCRFDLIEWIRGWHGTCPACRAEFANIRPPSYSEDGSSDGDYVPNDDEDEDDLDEDDGFMDTDGFDAEGEDYDLDFDLDGDEVDLASDVNAFIESGGGTRGHEGIDLAADVDAFMALFGSGRNPPRYPPEVNLAADANAFMREYTAGRNRDGSEAEVSQDLNADVEDDVVEDRAMWESAEDEAMENWGLSHSDGDASESLSEGELFGSMEDDMNVQDDAAAVAEPGSPSAEVPEAETK